MRRLLLTAILAAAGASASAPVSAQSAETAALLRRAGIYVQRFVDRFSNVVSEERYEQRLTSGRSRRRLTSDFLLVAYPGRPEFLMTFRDVLEVDGRPVAERRERVTELFLHPFENAVTRARDIHREGLQHSLRDGRLVDPLAVLVYLQPAYQRQFRLSRGGLVRSLGADVREISLAQPDAPPATRIRAKAWVSDATGEVVKTELRVGAGPSVGITTTTFEPDPALGVRVPATMTDSIRLFNDGYEGTATYANLRRFQVQTDSVVAPPVNPR